jgi:hypothetical protein
MLDDGVVTITRFIYTRSVDFRIGLAETRKLLINNGRMLYRDCYEFRENATRTRILDDLLRNILMRKLIMTTEQ